MTVTIHADPVPLRVEETGTIRVGSSRVTFDVLLADYKKGMTPEQIAQELDTLSLADIYAAIAYYHRHREEVEAYLQRRRAEAEALRQQIEAAQPDIAGLKARLLARLAEKQGGDTPAAQ
jgi:uncharacterized protein (DUF433 family)